MSSRAEMKTFSCIFPESVLYYRSTCRCDGMVDVVDSKSFGLIPRAGSIPATGTKIASMRYASEQFFYCQIGSARRV